MMKYLKHVIVLMLAIVLVDQSASAQRRKKKKKKKRGQAALHVAKDTLSKYRPRYTYKEEVFKGEVREVTRPGVSDDSTVVFRYDITRRLNRILDARPEEIVITKDVIGYRVQIYYGRNREEANRARSISLSMFPDLTPYPEHKTPTYRIKVGDFEKREEAYPIYRKLKKKFHHAIIVPDMIKVIRIATPEDLIQLRQKEAEMQRKRNRKKK